jgi:Lactoylglutathione lyase and related lyases
LRQKITLITLGVSDLARAVNFYEKALGWRKSSGSTENLALFDLDGYGLALYPRKLLAEDANVAEQDTGFSGVTLSFNAKSEAEVDEVLSEVSLHGALIAKAAQKVFWGGYSGYFKDPDGHLIEVAYNPFWELTEEGSMKIPP